MSSGIRILSFDVLVLLSKPVSRIIRRGSVLIVSLLCFYDVKILADQGSAAVCEPAVKLALGSLLTTSHNNL